MNKVYVDVVAEFRKDGQLVPIFFTWEDGRKYSIDRILKIERCASRKAGGVGMMYTCMIQGQESHLFYEVDKWFMERKTACSTIVATSGLFVIYINFNGIIITYFFNVSPLFSLSLFNKTLKMVVRKIRRSNENRTCLTYHTFNSIR